jgi:hypothetical protein
MGGLDFRDFPHSLCHRFGFGHPDLNKDIRFRHPKHPLHALSPDSAHLTLL